MAPRTGYLDAREEIRNERMMAREDRRIAAIAANGGRSAPQSEQSRAPGLTAESDWRATFGPKPVGWNNGTAPTISARDAAGMPTAPTRQVSYAPVPVPQRDSNGLAIDNPETIAKANSDYFGSNMGKKEGPITPAWTPRISARGSRIVPQAESDILLGAQDDSRVLGNYEAPAATPAGEFAGVTTDTGVVRPRNWQEDIALRYPNIGKAGTEENRLFVEAYKSDPTGNDPAALASRIQQIVAEQRQPARRTLRIAAR